MTLEIKFSPFLIKKRIIVTNGFSKADKTIMRSYERRAVSLFLV